MDTQEATRINQLLDRLQEAIRIRDIDTAVSFYAPDVLIFDMVGPLAHPRGADAVKTRLQQWMASFADNTSVGYTITDRTIRAAADTAFSYAFNHVSVPLKAGGLLDMYWRETLGWQKNKRRMEDHPRTQLRSL